jgi:hypothetical protein
MYLLTTLNIYVYHHQERNPKKIIFILTTSLRNLYSLNSSVTPSLRVTYPIPFSGYMIVTLSGLFKYCSLTLVRIYTSGNDGSVDRSGTGFGFFSLISLTLVSLLLRYQDRHHHFHDRHQDHSLLILPLTNFSEVNSFSPTSGSSRISPSSFSKIKKIDYF